MEASVNFPQETSDNSGTMVPFSLGSVRDELLNIGDWWASHMVDKQFNGYLGELDYFAQPVTSAAKGIVLNTRILWFFSEAALHTGNAVYAAQAERSYKWLLNNMLDTENGGFVWSVSPVGEVLEGKKQTYAQCFAVYALCSYFLLSKDNQALNCAFNTFQLVEKHARDKTHGGYIEACDQFWQEIDDFRLSDKDLNVPKSMNTHLHVVEAYSALYRVMPAPEVEEALHHVLSQFLTHIVCGQSKHLKLFFDMQWQDLSQTYSFGHDIEASWLLWEAAESLGNQAILNQVRTLAVEMAQVCLDEAIGERGQVCDDYEFSSNHRDERSYWWVQAEALVGFLNAFLLSGDSRFLAVCEPIWQFIQQYHIDQKNGEWHWLATCDQQNDDYIYKAGFWKAPYHNGRAMMELEKLFVEIESNLPQTEQQ